MATPDSETLALRELARVFLKLGITAFGGPAAHIALMRDEVVRRRHWLTEQQFLDLVGATNMIPGPNSTEMAIHIGHARAGWRGLLVSGSCFILPATLIVGGIAWAYVRFGTLPEAQALLYGIKPVIIAIVAMALWKLVQTAVKSRWLGALGLAAVTAVALGANEILVLASAGAAAALAQAFAKKSPRVPEITSAMVPIAAGAAADRGAAPALGAVLATGAASATGAATAVVLWKLFLVFFKAGALLFGSGYVLLAFLRADLVQRLGWLSERQLLDAVAVGQVTPGPVFTTATFIGYLLGGAPGAAIATVGIFLPAFVYVAASAPFLPRLRRSALAAAVLDGVNVASMALMVVVTWHLGRAALVDPLTISVAVISGALLLWGRVNSGWLILVGGVLGLVVGAS
jgi:chromate transporter